MTRIAQPSPRCGSVNPLTGEWCVLHAGHTIRHAGPRPLLVSGRFRDRWGKGTDSWGDVERETNQ